MSGPADADGRTWDDIYADMPAPSQEDVVAYLTWSAGAGMRAQGFQDAVAATERAKAMGGDAAAQDYRDYPVALHMQRIGLPIRRDTFIDRRWGAGYRPTLWDELEIPPALRQWPPMDPD